MNFENKKVGTHLGFISLILAIAIVALWFRQVNLVAIPEDRTLFVIAFLIAAGLGVASFVVGTRWFGGIAAVLAILVGALMNLTIYVSPQQVAENPIKVGDAIPGFTAIDDQGNRFTSDVLTGTPVLIKFFRAHW